MNAQTPEVANPLSIRTLLDECRESLYSRPFAETVSRFVGGLNAVRAAVDPATWQQVAEVACSHPIAADTRQDPITDHSFRRPRGYQGDAELIDHIYYGLEPTWPNRPPEGGVGQLIHDTLLRTPTAEAVRARRRFVAAAIDRLAAQCARPPLRVLSVASGHLRELELCESANRGAARFWALDQDSLSLELVEREHAVRGVTTICRSVFDLLTHPHDGAEYDVIYSLGLYEYLSEKVAQRLTARMFDMLSPGGTLLIANLKPGFPEHAYMETFMRWHLIYRDEREVAALSERIPVGRMHEDREIGVSEAVIIKQIRKV